MKWLFVLFISCAEVFSAIPFGIGDNPHILHSWDSDVRVYCNRVLAAGGLMTVQDKDAINRFVQSAKARGYWSYFIDAGPLAGNNTNAALVKLVAASGISTSLTNSGFTAADYSRSGSFNGGAGKWLNTGLRQDSLATNHHGCAVWFIDTMTNQLDASREIAFGTGTSIGQPYFSAYSNPFTLYDGQQTYSYTATINTTGGNINGGQRWGQGLQSVFRLETNSFRWWVNGMEVGFSTSFTVGTPHTNTLGIYAGTINGTSSERSLQQKSIGWYAYDNGIPTTLQSNYYSDVCLLMRRIGRINKPAFPQFTPFIIGQSLASGGGSPGIILKTAGTTRALGVGNAIATGGTTAYFRKGRSRLTEFNVETGWRAFSDHLIALCGANGYGTTNDPFIINWALPNQAYAALKKGAVGGTNVYTRAGLSTNNYQHSLNDLAFQTLFQNELIGNGIYVPAILAVHGESDILDIAYGTNMIQWQQDYQADIKTITGQSQNIPMFHSQPATTGFPGSTTNKPYSDLKLLEIFENNPSTHILVGPKYFIPTTDGTHLTAVGNQIQGEYYANALFSQVIQGQQWEPLRPTNIVRTGGTITITFNKLGLILDTTIVSDPGNYGFTYSDDSSPPSVSSVALAGASTNQVTITLSGTPTGSNKVIRYALNATVNNTAGPTTGARGCLRDANTSIGTRSGTNLFNWCVMFEKSAE